MNSVEDFLEDVFGTTDTTVYYLKRGEVHQGTVIDVSDDGSLYRVATFTGDVIILGKRFVHYSEGEARHGVYAELPR